jgi:hypothetical protein
MREDTACVEAIYSRRKASAWKGLESCALSYRKPVRFPYNGRGRDAKSSVPFARQSVSGTQWTTGAGIRKDSALLA